MNRNIPWETLARYFAGELTTEESEKMETWIKADPEREEQVRYLYRIWEESEVLPYELDVDIAWETLEGNIERFDKRLQTLDQSATGEMKKKRLSDLRVLEKSAQKPGRIGRRIVMVAASVLIILSAGFFTHNYYLELQEAEKAGELAVEELTTRDGERAIYSLSDGSRVILHAGSRLEVPVNFNNENRELFLEGEAYFEVSHDPDKPFVVNSEEAYTRVLGTKFLVQAWPEESRNVEVIVEEGRVALGDKRTISTTAQQEVVITLNQKGVLTAEDGPSVFDVTDLHWHLGWTEGRLVFEDRQLSEILPRLERWYAVEINSETDEIAEKRLTAEIDYSQPMTEVLMGIALSLDLEIDKEDRKITFRASGDQQGQI